MRRFLAAGLILLCAPAGAGWTLDPERSSVTYLSSKMAAESYAAIFEPNRFRRFSGGIGDDGEARVVIDLGSVDTGVERRDERVKEHVFMVAKHPQATVSLSLPRAARRGCKRTRIVAEAGSAGFGGIWWDFQGVGSERNLARKSVEKL